MIVDPERPDAPTRRWPFLVGWSLAAGAIVGWFLFAQAQTTAQPSGSVKPTQLPSFSYELQPLPEVWTAGDQLHLEWAPHPDPNYTTLTSDVTLCFAFFGPSPDAETVKRELKAPSSNIPACPPPGTAVTSTNVRTSTAAGTRLKIEASAPDRPGFYSLRQIMLVGPATKDGRVGSGSRILNLIVEVRAR